MKYKSLSGFIFAKKQINYIKYKIKPTQKKHKKDTKKQYSN